jgi:vitamin B12 transporter
MKAVKQIGTLGVACLLAVTLLAQEGEVELDPVTITATLHPVSSSSTGRNMIVIKGEQFFKLPVNSVDELLRYLPGLEVQMRGPMGTQSDIVLRGGTFQQVLVVLDGVRINDPNTGHFNSYIPIAPAEIDRIEILKGASSAIYGSEAVGGVINIVTKTFSSKKGQEKKQFVAQGTAGQYGLLNGNFGGVYQKGSTSVAAGVLSNNATGQQQRGTTGYFHNTTASVSINQFFNENWNVAFRSSYDRRRFAAQNFYTSFVSDTASERVATFWNQLSVGFVKKQRALSLDLGYKSVNDQYQFNSVGSPNSNISNLFQGLAKYKWEAGNSTTFTTGGQWVNKQMKSNDRGDHTLNQAGGFLIVDQKIGTAANISPAVRIEWNESSGWQLVPQINLSYKVPDWQLRASAGRTTRDADFTERYNNYNKPFVASGSIGNPDLISENSFSYEAGADFFGIRSLKISGTFFQQYFTHLIDYVTTPYADMPRKENLSPTGTYALAKNIGTVNTTGFETDLQFNRTFRNNQHFWATLGFTWIDSKSGDATPSFYLSSHAKFLTNFNLSYGIKWFSVSVNGLYKERQQQSSSPINASVSKDYFILNMQLQGFIIPNKISLFGQADNLFNKQYSDLLGSVMPGRWLMAGFKVLL